MNLRIAEPGYKLLLFQLSPGLEIPFAYDLMGRLQSLKERGDIFNFALWKLFGTYDVLCIYEVPDFRPDLIYTGSLPGIRKSNEILTFAWQEATNPERRTLNLTALSTYPIVGLSFYKIDRRHLHKHSSGLEESFMSYLLNRGNVHALSTLGWAEVVKLTPGHTMKEVFNSIHSWTTGMQLRPQAPHTPSTLFTKSYSFLGLNYSILSSSVVLQASLPEPFGRHADENSDPVVELRLKCSPHDVERIAKECTTRFQIEQTGIADIVMGQDDVSVDLSRSLLPTWGRFVETLLDLRKDLTLAVLETTTQIQRKAALTTTPMPAKPRTLPPLFSLPAESVRSLDQFSESVRRATLDAIYSFNALISDELTRDCYSDLFRFINSIVVHLRSNTLAAQMNSEQLEKRLERLAFAIEQRSMGTFSGLESTYGRFAPVKGGVQRIAMALNALPRFLIESTCGTDWPGFPVIGFDRRFWHFAEIVNLPVDRTFDPSTWWGLTHESAHALLHLNQGWFRLNLVTDLLEKRLDRIVDAHDKTEITELLFDCFDFAYAFAHDWKFYLETIWSYLRPFVLEGGDEFVESRLASYILRTFCVYSYWKRPDGSVASLSVKRLRDEYQMFWEDFEETVDLTHLDSERVREAKAESLLRFSEIRPAFRELARSVELYRQKFQTWQTRSTRSRVKRDVELVLRGEVCRDLRNPVMFVRELLRSKNNAFPVRIAAILSLWHFFLRNYSDDPYFRIEKEVAAGRTPTRSKTQKQRT